MLTFSFITCDAEDVPSDLPKNYVVNDGGEIKHNGDYHDFSFHIHYFTIKDT